MCSHCYELHPKFDRNLLTNQDFFLLQTANLALLHDQTVIVGKPRLKRNGSTSTQSVQHNLFEGSTMKNGLWIKHCVCSQKTHTHNRKDNIKSRAVSDKRDRHAFGLARNEEKTPSHRAEHPPTRKHWRLASSTWSKHKHNQKQSFFHLGRLMTETAIAKLLTTTWQPCFFECRNNTP